jgi:hypothetical protein
MLKNNIYNIDREFDYPTIKGIVIQSLEKIVKEEVLKNTANIPHDTIFEDNDYPNLNLLHIYQLKMYDLLIIIMCT